MSLTSVVPSGVPSLFQSSAPWVPSSALKNKLFPTALIPARSKAPPSPGLMSLTRVVPPGVPSVFQSSTPWMLSLA